MPEGLVLLGIVKPIEHIGITLYSYPNYSNVLFVLLHSITLLYYSDILFNIITKDHRVCSCFPPKLRTKCMMDGLGWRLKQGASASHKDEPPAKRRGTGQHRDRDHDEEDLQHTIRALSILTLQNSQQLRALASTNFFTLLVPSSQPIVVAGKEAGKTYLQQAQVKRVEGHPHAHIYVAMMEVMAVGPKIKENKDHQAIIEGISTHHRTASVTDIEDLISYLRVKDAYSKDDNKFTKVQFSFNHFTSAKITVGSEEMTGMQLTHIMSRL